MAFTTTKTDWGEEVLNNTALNRIEENTQGNHDDSTTNTADIATINTNIDQPVLTTSNVTHNNITTTNNVTIGGKINPTIVPTSTIYTIGTGTVQVIPRGAHNYVWTAIGSSGMVFEYYISGGWRNSGNTAAPNGGFYSDGVNVRINNASGVTQTVYLLTF